LPEEVYLDLMAGAARFAANDTEQAPLWLEAMDRAEGKWIDVSEPPPEP
jgi:hypothetical protein